MEPVTVLTDGERCINFEKIKPLFEDWIASAPSDSVKETGRGIGKIPVLHSGLQER